MRSELTGAGVSTTASLSSASLVVALTIFVGRGSGVGEAERLAGIIEQGLRVESEKEFDAMAPKNTRNTTKSSSFQTRLPFTSLKSKGQSIPEKRKHHGKSLETATTYSSSPPVPASSDIIDLTAETQQLHSERYATPKRRKMSPLPQKQNRESSHLLHKQACNSHN